MRPRELLSITAHRPWGLPQGPWIMAQTWRDLLFAHWPVSPAALRPHVPPQLELDLHDGRAWLGVVPFRMTGVRLHGLPAVPGTSAFEELNVRTYVRHRDRPGVWFFSLDARSALAVRVARAWFRLPYFDAEMGSEERDGLFTYGSHRTHRGAPPAGLYMTYRATGAEEPSQPGSVEAFLTERYRLYAVHGEKVLAGDIHHVPWPLQPATCEIQENTMARALGLALEEPPELLHFARALDVVVWRPRRVE